MRRLVSPLMCIALCVPCSAVAADKEASSDKSGHLKVGDKAPTFQLKDQAGKERTLEELLKSGKVALVFHRSAQW